MTVSVLCLFLAVPWVGIQCVIVAFPALSKILFFVLCNAALLWFIYFDYYFGGIVYRILFAFISFKNTT